MIMSWTPRPGDLHYTAIGALTGVGESSVQGWLPLDSEVAAEVGFRLLERAEARRLVARRDPVGRHVVLHAARVLVAALAELEIDPPRLAVAELALLLTFEAAPAAIEAQVAALVALCDEEHPALQRGPIEMTIERGVEGEDPIARVGEWLLALLEAAALAPRWSAIDELVLRFPTTWAAPVNPAAAAVADDVEGWLTEIGVIKTPRLAKVFRDLAVAEYAGWPCPWAQVDRLWVVMGFFALWIFHDDVLEGMGARSAELLADAVAGRIERDSVELANRYVRGWAELGWRLAARMKAPWLARHHERFLDWARALSTEAEHLRCYRRSAVPPNVDTYLDLRRRTIGVRPTLDFIEFIDGVELSEEFWALPEVEILSELAAELVALHNDFFALSKDVEQRMMNLVLSRMGEGRRPLDALRDLVDLHHQRIEVFSATAERLLEAVDPEEEAQARAWVAGVERMILGFARWHVVAARYSDVHRLPGGHLVRLRVVCANSAMGDAGHDCFE